jgi:aminocarboxymuconate-semialdehyde decarboxylase
MSPVIDIHAHFVAPALIAEAARHGQHYQVRVERDDAGERVVLPGEIRLRPFLPELCDLACRLPTLEADGIERQVLSTWTEMAGDLLPVPEGVRWARLQNETLADAARWRPDTFEAMGTLPMQDVAAAIQELNHLVRNLGMRSVEIGTNVNGRDLDRLEFRPLWKAICDLDVFVLLHPPLQPVGGERTSAYFLNNLIGYPVDTTIAAARLMFSGLLNELPGLKCCLAHAGGFLPYQIGRMQRGFDANPVCRATLKKPPVALLNAFYYDTLTHSDAALEFLLNVVDNDRILYGSDYPFEMLDPNGPRRIKRLAGRSQSEIAAILGGNAVLAFGAMRGEYGPKIRQQDA